MKKNFTVICGNCSNKQKLQDGNDYEYEGVVRITTCVVKEDGVSIECESCGQEILINLH